MYYRQLLLFTLFVVILYKMDRTRTDKSIVLARSIFIALLYFLLHQLILSNEGFHFEVTDWKKTCGQDRGMQCDQCCAPGFNGQNVCFDYTGDHERMNMQQAGCSCPAREFPANNPNDYLELDSTCASKEDYSRGDYVHMANTSPCNAKRNVAPCSLEEGFQHRRSSHVELGQTQACNAGDSNVQC